MLRGGSRSAAAAHESNSSPNGSATELDNHHAHHLPRSPPEGLLVDSRLSKRPWYVQLEYAFYIANTTIVIGYGVYRIYLQGIDPLMLARHPLEPAWFFPEIFKGVDMRDHQLRMFIFHGKLLCAAFGAYVIVSRLARALRPDSLLYVHLLLNTLFLLYLHGPPLVFAVGIMAINFAWSKLHHTLPFRIYYLLPWFLHLGVLFYVTINNGIRFAAVSSSLAWLDAWGGGMMRWYAIFNMSTLRMLGYNYDVWEAYERGEATKAEQEAKHSTCTDCVEFHAPCYRLRTAVPRPLAEYNFITYVTYITYIPLYIGGPLSSFNAYISHVHSPQRTFDFVKILRYTFRTAMNFLCLIVLLHVNHLLVLRKDDYAFSRMILSDKLYYGLQFLAFLWLKFNVIWKSFRIFGLLDGVEAPEDMNRCFSNTTLVAEFWRDWHASFNLWIVRYMYVPMGGNKSKGLAIFPIFIFIAVWHDIELHLLWWAGIMCLAFIPELIVGAIFARKFKWVRTKPYYRHVQALGGVGSTLALIVANLFGFGTEMSSTDGVAGLFATPSCIFVTTLLLFCSNNIAIQERCVRREAELRRRQQLGLNTPMPMAEGALSA